jgi:hypothetical protein
MSDIDLPMAESAYATLLDARHKPRNIAADLVVPVGNLIWLAVDRESGDAVVQ